MPATPSTKRWRLATGALLLVAFATVATAAVWIVAQPIATALAPEATASATKAAVASASPTPIPTPTTTGTLAVLGDSYVKGVGASTDYVTVLGRELGVTTVKFGQTSTGLVNIGTGQPYDGRLASVLYTKPAGLVVQASVNDYLTSTDAVAAAARVLVDHARTIDPDLPIALVGPIFLDTQYQPAILAQRAALKKVSAELDITYVDPTGWITDATKPIYISGDNLHPTPAGYERLGTKLADALRQFAADLP